MSSNSIVVMAKAKSPGLKRRGILLGVKSGWVQSEEGDSKRRWEVRRERNIIGARWKIVLKGFEVAGVCWRRSWVRDHLRPESAEAVMTSTKLQVNQLPNRGERGGWRYPMNTN
jgi:hypothetical protein